jgi:hypothetical protein
LIGESRSITLANTTTNTCLSNGFIASGQSSVDFPGSEVIYHGEPVNPAPRQFYDNLVGDEFEQTNNETIDVEDGEELYLETNLEGLKGKKVGLA